MYIPENIKEIIGVVNPEEAAVYIAGLSLFAYWLYTTSLGRKSLEDSVPRRNSMPLYVPLALFFAIFLSIAVLGDLATRLTENLQKWQETLVVSLVSDAVGLVSIVIILHFVRLYFVRGIKGFGLNVRTIPKDIVMAVLNLIAIWPLMDIAFYVIIVINQQLYGPGHEIPVHEVLQSISESHSLAVRTAIAAGAAIITPVLEEMLFRGLFQTAIRSALDSRYAAWIAIFVTSLFFVINHANASHWPVLFILSLGLGYSYEKSGSLFRPIFIHALFNTSAVVITWLT